MSKTMLKTNGASETWVARWAQYCTTGVEHMLNIIYMEYSKYDNEERRFSWPLRVQWNLSITTTSIIKFIPCDLLSNAL